MKNVLIGSSVPLRGDVEMAVERGCVLKGSIVRKTESADRPVSSMRAVLIDNIAKHQRVDVESLVIQSPTKGVGVMKPALRVDASLGVLMTLKSYLGTMRLMWRHL